MIGNYTRIDTSNTFWSGLCGPTSSTTPIGEYNYIKSLGCDSTKIADYIFSLNSQIRPLLIKQKNGTITQLEKDRLSWMQRHLRYAIYQWAWCMKKDGKKRQVYDWYSSQTP
jgi:hypothetical protein